MKSAFSLVELSIVLVILGLLTGGILSGQSLIRASELRNFTSQYESYQSAINTFKGKYFYTPGDLPNAASFWGAPGNNIANCPATAGTGTQTCNGDGDGEVGGNGASQYGERFMFWQHLANAGLITGTYTGMSGADGFRDSVPNVNTPNSKIGEVVWFISSSGDDESTVSSYFSIVYGNYMLVGGDTGNNNRPHGTFLTAEELWNIDTKKDDGKPGQGKIIAGEWDSCTDATVTTDINSDYLFTSAAKACTLFFRDAF